MPTALNSVFQSIANAIRNKTGKSATMTPGNMANEINSFPTWRSKYTVYTESEEDMFSGGFHISDPLFNKPVIIGNKLASCRNMFYYCNNFNQLITIPNGVVDCSSMFYSCNNFNQPITIPNNVVNCNYMFYSCNSFNQPITIPNSVMSCNYMFSGCKNFNQLITIPNSVISCSYMFGSCGNFNQPITIPNSVVDCSYMFYNCINMNRDIKLLHTTQSVNISGMLSSMNNSKRKNIYCANLSLLNAKDTSSLIGRSITWSTTTNGYYNATYNVYILNNI